MLYEKKGCAMRQKLIDSRVFAIVVTSARLASLLLAVALLFPYMVSNDPMWLAWAAVLAFVYVGSSAVMFWLIGDGDMRLGISRRTFQN